MKEVLGSLPEVITAYKNYNLLVPTATDVQLNPFYKFHVEEVPVDLGENSGDIFKVGSVKTGEQDERGKDIWEDVFSFALNVREEADADENNKGINRTGNVRT